MTTAPVQVLLVARERAQGGPVVEALERLGAKVVLGDPSGTNEAELDLVVTLRGAQSDDVVARLVESSAVPVVLVVDALTPGAIEDAWRLGAADAWAVPFDQEWERRASRLIRRGQAARRARAVSRAVRGLSDDVLRKLVSLERENFELRQGGGEKRASDSPAASGPSVAEEADRLLIVDDEPVIVSMLKEALAPTGLAVDGAGTAEEGLEKMRRAQYAVVLTDKNLPGMSGIDLVRKARSVAPATAIILMTGYASLSSAIEAINLGAAGYITKPFQDLNEIVEQVKQTATLAHQKLKAERIFRVFMEHHRETVERLRALEQVE